MLISIETALNNFASAVQHFVRGGVDHAPLRPSLSGEPQHGRGDLLCESFYYQDIIVVPLAPVHVLT